LPHLIFRRPDVAVLKREKGMSRNEQILDAIRRWAARHPKPDEPTLSTGSGQYSPNQIVTEIHGQTRAGMMFLALVEHSAKVHGIEEVLDSFDQASLTRVK